MIEETEGERRVDDIGRDVFDRAVANAATIATQNVSRIHRRRLVTQTAIATFVICIGIALILAFALKGAADSQSRSFALDNCHLVTQLATPLANFVKSDATLRQKQASLGAHGVIGRKFSQLFGTKNFLQAERQSAKLNSATTAYWDNAVVPQLRSVAGANCQLRLR